MIYTGKSADGSDIYPVEGAYISPDGKTWSNMPFTKEHRIQRTIYKHLRKHLRSIPEEMDLIDTGKSNLPKACRNYLANFLKNNFDYSK